MRVETLPKSFGVFNEEFAERVRMHPGIRENADGWQMDSEDEGRPQF
jgi:hypothetical protein